MASTKRTAPRKTAAKKRPAKRPPVARKTLARRPRGGSFPQRMAVRLAHFIARQAEGRRATVRTRKDAAILRTTHAGCAKCHGTGTIYTRGKDGNFTGSKPCTAKPATTQVSRTQVAKAARFGPDKRSGLIGWRCPCGKKEKPRYRDAKVATKALRTHERERHGGQTIGGAWYAQLPESAKPVTGKAPVAQPVSKVTANSGMTDVDWEKQNKPMAPATATKKGLCWQCAGNGALYSAFGGQQITVVCGECTGTGKAKATATP
jgi:hypothetical protein